MQKLAMGTPEISNNPVVASPLKNESTDLAGRIENALHQDSRLANDHFTVDVNDTEITLKGAAASAKEKQTATSIAESFAINRRVVANIAVNGQKPRN